MSEGVIMIDVGVGRMIGDVRMGMGIVMSEGTTGGIREDDCLWSK